MCNYSIFLFVKIIDFFSKKHQNKQKLFYIKPNNHLNRGRQFCGLKNSLHIQWGNKHWHTQFKHKHWSIFIIQCTAWKKKTVWLNFIFVSLTTADSLVAIKNEIISKYARLFLPFFSGGVLFFSFLNFSLALSPNLSLALLFMIRAPIALFFSSSINLALSRCYRI